MYWIIDYRGDFAYNPQHADVYRDCLKEFFDTCALTVVRFGGEALQRSLARLVSMKLHEPSNMYDSYAEALEVVRRIRDGKIEVKGVGS